MNYKLLYKSPNIKTPYGIKKLIFADDTASGRPCPIIDNIILTKIIPYYSNTHSNAFCGQYMNNYIDKTRDYIRQKFELTQEHKIIFTGNGATGAINHLVNSINTNQYKQVNIFISMFEHHSNYLPWYELSKKNKNVILHMIPLTDCDEINFVWLEEELAKKQDCVNLNLISLIVCSNVTGLFLDIKYIYNLINKFNVIKKINYILYDGACISPHKFLSGKYYDALFISGHKYLGGPGSCGLLIAHSDLFKNGRPYAPGGGCVIEADKSHVIYLEDIEKKESAGTPNILGIIRLYYCMKLLEQMYDLIQTREHIISKYIYKQFNILQTKYHQFHIILNNKQNRLPIISFNIDNIHFNFIVILLNDLFGIQSRGGISCSGIFGEYMLKKYNIGGWCRITFNYIMSKKIIDYIIGAVEFIIINYKNYKEHYTYDKIKNIYYYKEN